MATIEEYEALTSAINTGVTQYRVRYGDREETKTYRSLEDMRRIQRQMANELGLSRPNNRVFASFQKGLAK